MVFHFSILGFKDNSIITGNFPYITPISYQFFHLFSYYGIQGGKGCQVVAFFIEESICLDVIVVNMESKPKFTPNPSLKLLNQVRETLRYNHYAYRTIAS